MPNAEQPPPAAGPAGQRLILASASPRRRELLGQLGVAFEVLTAEVTEHEDPAAEPRAMVAHNAALKAEWVAARHPDALVLGADTTVFVDGTVLNKPRDLAEARAMLRRLSGRTHTVFTGLALRRAADGLRIDAGEASEVTFKPLDEPAIEAYLAKVHVLDKAGAYAIQEQAGLIVASYTGSLSNIIGLPLETTKHILTTCGLPATVPNSTDCMSSVLSAPPEPQEPQRRRRRMPVPRFSSDPDVRSVQVGLVATLLIHLLLLLLLPSVLRRDSASSLAKQDKVEQFNVELAPEPEAPPKAPTPLKFVETNPDAPENIPDKTNNFGAQNQQAAQEKPNPDEKNDRPAIEGQKDIQSTQIVDGRLTQPNLPKDAVPAPQTPPTPEVTTPTKRAQDPLSGFEKLEGDVKDSVGTSVAKVSPNANDAPQKVEGMKDAPLIADAQSPTIHIDPRKPQPRPQLQRNVRPAVFQENKLGTQNIGPVAYDAKWSNYGQYLQKMIEAIQARWDDYIASSGTYPTPGSRVSVTFTMDSSGRIAGIGKVDDGHSGELATNWCVSAISPSADFTYGVWTDDMIAILGDKQELTFTFFYQ